MKRFIYILFLTLTALVSCERDSGFAQEQEEAASLEVFLSVPEVSISTKGLDDPWDEDMSDWTNWDLFTDGMSIYELTLLLIDSDGNLVGFRDMYAPESGDNKYVDSDNGIWDGSKVLDESTVSGKEFKASFIYDTPQGSRSIEKLKRGVYTLLAVSNYRPIPGDVTGTKDYDGLKGAVGSSLTINTPFTDIIKEIENEYLTSNGISGFKSSQLYEQLWTFNIVTDANNLCHKQPQPLTAVREIELRPGKNTVNLSLERTYVRVRVEIENNSSVAALTVNDFDFCDWFTQRAVYLFNDPKDNARNYEVRYQDGTGLNTHKKSPVLKNETGHDNTVDNAIVDIAKSSTIIDPGTSRVIFDGYVFGSKLGATDPDYQNDSTYQYKLDVEYVGKTYELSPELLSTTPISSSADVAAGQYLIQMVRNPAFLYVTDQDNLATNSTLYEIEQELKAKTTTHIWELESRTDGGYYLKNLSEGRYIDVPDDDLIITVVSKNENAYFQLSDMTGGVQIMGTNDRYLNQHNWTNTDGYPVTNWIKDDAGNPCVFYPVTAGGTLPASFNRNIDLELIDPITAAVYPVQNIKRNDFINILISVTYVPTSNQFKIENMVKGWSQKDMDIEFN